MWINGKEMVGEVVEKARARRIYESYKARKIDPGLLEQTDYKTFEMRVFPVAPRAEQKIRITYYQELDFDNDWVTFVYPLATAPRPGLVQKTTGKFGLSLEVISNVPIQKMESPSHPDDFVITDHATRCYHASLETTGGDMSRDVVVAYRLARAVTGVDLVASKPEGEDGYFALTITAGSELDRPETGADYVFVLDVSGSMRHDGKLRLSRNSIGAFIQALEARDRFEVITFNVRPATLFNRLQPSNEANRREAIRFLGSAEARGGTRLRPAMAVAYKYGEPDRTLNVVILSDGMTEQQERRELIDLIRSRPARARVFCVGVGNDVDRPLLRKVADDAGGFAAFLSQEDDLERQARAFRRKVARPAATDLRLTFGGAEVYDLEPRRLPNLYHGMPVRVYGRYRGSGPTEIRLESTVEGRSVRQDSRFDFPAVTGGNPLIERMWAWRRIQRLRGPAQASTGQAAVDEIVRLGEGYSIASEWTSFIVLENDGEYQRWKIDRKNALRIRRDRTIDRKLRERFAAIQAKADAGLGPGALEPGTPAETRVSTPPDVRPTTPRRNWPSFGVGAIDPISGGIIAAAGALVWLSRRRRRTHDCR